MKLELFLMLTFQHFNLLKKCIIMLINSLVAVLRFFFHNFVPLVFNNVEGVAFTVHWIAALVRCLRTWSLSFVEWGSFIWSELVKVVILIFRRRWENGIWALCQLPTNLTGASILSNVIIRVYKLSLINTNWKFLRSVNQIMKSGISTWGSSCFLNWRC